MTDTLMLAVWPLLTSGPGACELREELPAPPRAGKQAKRAGSSRAGKGPAVSSKATAHAATARVTETFVVPLLGYTAVFEGRVCVSTGLREGRGRVVALHEHRGYEAGVSVAAVWRAGVPQGPITWTDTEEGESIVVDGVNEDGLCGAAVEYYADGDIKFRGEYACR